MMNYCLEGDVFTGVSHKAKIFEVVRIFIDRQTLKVLVPLGHFERDLSWKKNKLKAKAFMLGG